MRFRACKTVLGASQCTWEIVYVKEQKCTLLTITWYSGRNCTKLVLKPLADQDGLSISILCTAPFLYFILFQFTPWLPSQFVFTIWSIYRAVLSFLIKWNEKWCSESNILTMDHELVLEKTSSFAVCTLPNTIIHLKTVTYLTIRLRQIYLTNLELKISDTKDWGSNAALSL